MSEEKTARAELAAAYRQVAALGLNQLASGNLSLRLGEGMLISPTGASAENLTEDALVYVDGEGRWAAGQRPSSEWRMHAAIYRDVPGAGAVVHTHSDYCVAVACQDMPLPGFHYLIGLFGGDDVPCVPYSTFGGEGLAEAAAAALKHRKACLLANHGMIAHAPSLNGAVGLAHRLEILCRQYVLTRQLGPPTLLNETHWEEFFAKVKQTRYRN
jgi:L-fuculose-phosphate aldolase